MSGNRVSLVGIDGLSEEHHALGFPETERPMHPTTHFVADVRIGCKLTAALRSGTRFGRPAYSPRHAYAPSEGPDINSSSRKPTGELMSAHSSQRSPTHCSTCSSLQRILSQSSPSDSQGRPIGFRLFDGSRSDFQMSLIRTGPGLREPLQPAHGRFQRQTSVTIHPCIH